LTITIKEDGTVKGSTFGVNVVYFFAILFLIAGFLMMVTLSLAGFVLVIFAVTMIYVAFNHNLKVQQKKLDGYYEKYFNTQYHNPVPISGVESPKRNKINGIKVIKKGNKVVATGMPSRVKGALLTGILILILCVFVSGSAPNRMNVLAIAIFAIVIIIGSIIVALRERQKAVREYKKGESTNNV